MSKITRVTITLPAELLTGADARARQLDRSRSWVVAEALRGYLGASAVRDPAAPAYATGRPAGLGEYRLHQLESDLALTAEQRVREAERTAREAPAPRARSQSVRVFERYEDYLEWKRREGI